MNTNSESSGLGSLTQAARGKQLKSARTILLVVGILSLLANSVMTFLSEGIIDREFKKELVVLRGQGMEIDQTRLEELKSQSVRSFRLISGAGAAIGLAFIVLGVYVKRFPVPTTITGLVLYLGSNAVFGFLDPMSLAKGWIIKIVFIVGLFKAVKAAIAYEKENQRETPMPTPELIE